MGIRLGFMCKLLLGGFGMDNVFDFNKNLDLILFHFVINLSNDGMGNKEAPRIQAVVWRQVPQGEKGDLPVHYLIYLKYVV